MKKINYMASLWLASACLVACNEDFTDWAAAQSYPQEEAATATVSLSPVTSIALEGQTGDSVTIATVASLAEGCTLGSCTVELEAEGQTLSVAAGVSGDALKVRLTDLNNKVTALYGSQKTTEREVTMKLTPIVKSAAGEALLLSATQSTIGVTPVATPAVDANGYYIVGGLNNWSTDKTTALAMEKESDTQYSVSVKADADFEFKIFPAAALDDADWTQALGASNDADGASLLAFRDKEGNDPANLTCAGGSTMKITIDVENYTYTIKQSLPEEMYIIGSPCNWSWDDATEMIPVTQTAGMFWSMQYYAAGDEIKFNSATSWNGTDFGYSDEEITPESVTLAQLTDNGGNIKVGKSGWYLVVITVTDEGRTIEFREPEVYLLGGLTNTSWSCDETSIFTVPDTKDGEFVSPAALSDGVARICVTVTGDWWRSEFTLDDDGVIVYRENKNVSDSLADLGYECNVAAGQKVYINFSSGTGIVK